MRAAVLAVALLVGCREHHPPPVEPPAHDPSDAWERVLSAAVTRGYVDYDHVHAHRDALHDYVAWLSTRDSRPRASRARYAWWLNAYTALSIHLVLEQGRPDRVHRGDSWRAHHRVPFYTRHSFTVGWDRMSLWDIHHERLRFRQLDYRSIAGTSCPERSCPPVRGELYVGRQLPTQLEDQLRTWTSDPERGIREEDGVLWLNPLFERYRRDLLTWSARPDLCSFLAEHTDPPLSEVLERAAARGCPHRVMAFDHRLNHAPRVPGSLPAAPLHPAGTGDYADTGEAGEDRDPG